MKIFIEIDTDYYHPTQDGYSTHYQLYQALLNLMPRRAQITELLVEEYPRNASLPYYTPVDKFIR